MSQSTGLFDSLKRLSATLLGIIQTRLELLSNEIEEERLRLSQMFIYGCLVLFCFGLAIMLLTVFIVVLFWDTYRLQVLGALSALFFIAGLLALTWLRRLARKKPKLFSATLGELSKDREQLASPYE